MVRIRVTDEMMPSFRITLLAVHQGQTLTDSVKIDVQDECRVDAKITLQTTLTNAEPGKVGTITVNGTPNTVVGLMGVDKAVYVLRNKGLLTKDKMFSKMEEHDLGCGPGGGRDTQSVLANAGLIFLSDTSTDTDAPERPSCTERRLNKRSIRDDVLSQEDETLRECCKVGMYADEFKRSCEERAEIIDLYHTKDDCAKVFQRCCNLTAHLHSHIADTEGLISLGDDLDFVDDSELLEREGTTAKRTDFRETIVVDTGVIGGDNSWVVHLTLPDSITTWVIQAVGINPRQGMCVADPIEALAFKDVFIQLKLPYSVVRNEQIELRATIFNYGKNRIMVKVYMYGVEGLCSEAEPNERGSVKHVVLSGQGSAATVAFPVVPLEVGIFTIKVAAISANKQDLIVQKLNVVAEGIAHEENIKFEVDPANLLKRKERNIVSDEYTTRIEEDRMRQVSTVGLQPRQAYIPGTESCVITAIGDRFGPTVHTVLNNPDKLINMPQGCGEQTMAFMAPTLYTLHYLKVTKKLNAEQEANGYKFIREGYGRELSFRKPDGSYAAWIDRPSSTWLTAFVAKVFCQSRRYVFIDDKTICSALEWLVKNQKPDGSFVDDNPIIHKKMMGGIQGAIPLTAFVLNALCKCVCNQVDIIDAKVKAILYLVKELPKITDPYYLSIVAYALSLADPTGAGLDANKLLLEKAKVDEGLNYRYWGEPGTALAVETTSYALLTQLIHNNVDSAGSIVNWLNTQRTGSGSFWSTQDTVIALEALAEYAIIARDDVMSLSCNLTASNYAHFNEKIDFTPENARVLRSYELSKLGGVLHLEAQGTGVALVNVQLKYNVPKQPDEICKFDIDINVTDAKEEVKEQQLKVLNKAMVEELAPVIPPPRRKPPSSNNVANISLCVQYLYHQDSNMAIIDVGIFTGYQVDKKDLRSIVKDPTLPVDRYELAGRSVIFYLDKIGHEQKTCFWFRAERQYIVGNMESSVIRVYDYYKPDHACSEFFSPNKLSAVMQTKCAGEICQCAEGGCPPKEPFMKIMQAATYSRQKKLLLELACEKEYFVWKVEVERVKNDSSSFQTVEVRVLRVLREGRESRDVLMGSPQRQFLGRRHCDSVELTPGKTYIIIGTDNEPIEQKDGIRKYLYYINMQTRVYEWFSVSDKMEPKNKSKQLVKLQNTFNWLEKEFHKNGGCDH